MLASGKSFSLFLLFGLTAMPSLLPGQGTITSVTGASPAGPVTGITANSPLDGFTLSLNGNFNSSAVAEVHWVNTASSQPDTCFSNNPSLCVNTDGPAGPLGEVTSTQVTLTIPNYLFSGSVTTRQTVQVYESEISGASVVDSNRVNFYINPQPSPANYTLPDGTVGVLYTSPIETGGTGPYTTPSTPSYGSLPPGTLLQNNADNSSLVLAGTPTTAGNYYYFQATVTDAWGNVDPYSTHSLSIFPMPVITPPLMPSAVAAGTPSVTIAITGQGFVQPLTGEVQRAGSGVTWTAGGTTVDLQATVNSDTQILATVPYQLLLTPGIAAIQVIQPNGTQSNAAPFTVSGPVISSLAPQSVVAGSGSFILTVNGGYFLGLGPGSGSPVVEFVNTPLSTTFVNANTLTAIVPANLLTASGNFAVRVVNPGGLSSAPFTFSILSPIPPLQMSGTAPNGTVGLPYAAGFSASGGTPGYQFSIAGGSLPPGLTLATNGNLTGTPTQAGQFKFTVQVADSTGANTSLGFVVTIAPPPLVLSGSLGDTALGTAVNAKFSATGGVPPYSFSVAGALPSGTSFSNATITGTTNSPGTFVFTISVTDSASTTVSKVFTVKVAVGPLALTGGLGDGQVNVAYAGQVGATGGLPPYSFSASGLPPGVSLSSSGAAGGTPTTSGTFSAIVTVTDSAGSHTSQTFTVNVAGAPLSITTAALSDGSVGTPYAASLAATGGVPPYSWSFSGLPDGVTGSAGGALNGAPTATGTFQVTASVSDSKGAKASRSYTVNIAIAPLSITSTSLPGGTVGVPVSGSVSAAGGVPPYQWSAAGLPAGVSLSAGGVLSGTPTAPGTFSVSLTATDSKGAPASKTLSMTVALPGSPSVTFGSLPASTNPASQPTVTIGLGNTFPADVVANLAMTFAPDSGPDDPSVQFSTGGRTAQEIIPAGSTVSPAQVGVQTGTVAGLITITAHLTAAGQDITGTPIPTITIRVNATAPVISTVTATRNSTGLTVTVVGFASSREMAQAIFQFTAAAGTTLTSSSVTVPVDAIFGQWYQSSASAAFGSQFTYTQPFTVPGGAQSIVSVSVTLVSKVGSSNAVSATLQ
jgi:hypothetical protein